MKDSNDTTPDAKPIPTAPGTGPASTARTNPPPPVSAAPTETKFSESAPKSPGPSVPHRAPEPDPWAPSGELLRQIAATLNGEEATPAVKQWADLHKRLA